ncbi:hypothetical protein [Streptomyces sp. NPDC096012]|uniref:hypothetical protein n=1 Tax=Streptomyces sp. NPDC096012 TaxID=3155684 RepID=UPI003369CA4D
MAVGSGLRLVVVGEIDVDQEELDSLTAQLRRRLLEIDVDDVRTVPSGDALPDGAKAGELIAVGALAVSLAPAVLRPALRLVETWMKNRPVKSVKLEMDGRVIELGHVSAEQQQQLIEAFLAPGPVPDSATDGTGQSAGAQE